MEKMRKLLEKAEVANPKIRVVYNIANALGLNYIIRVSTRKLRRSTLKYMR